MVDVIAFLPVDYILLALGVPILFIAWTRALRLLKVPRAIQLAFKVHVDSAKKNKYARLYILCMFYLMLNHIAACIMHSICQAAYKDHHDTDKADLVFIKKRKIFINSNSLMQILV